MSYPEDEFRMLSAQMEHLVTEHEDKIEHWRAFSCAQDRRIKRLEACLQRAIECLVSDQPSSIPVTIRILGGKA